MSIQKVSLEKDLFFASVARNLVRTDVLMYLDLVWTLVLYGQTLGHQAKLKENTLIITYMTTKWRIVIYYVVGIS